MNKKSISRLTAFLLVTMLYTACSKKSTTVVPQLTLSSSEELFIADGGTSAVTVTSNSKWNVSNTSTWCTATASVAEGNGKINLDVQANPGTSERSFVFNVSAGSISKELKVRQLGKAVPDSIPADASGMSSDAVTLAARLKLGLNIGNTLEAIGGETAWGNPKITKAFVDLAKQSGFNAIRLPCAWNQYTVVPGATQLKTEWLNRVKEVVQYCIDNGLYVILNIHWDGGWLENNCTPDKQTAVNARQKEFWKQIALHLRDYDEHLIFASANEPHVENEVQMNVLLSYHQTFINAVRATGGRNSYRVLVVQGPSTDIDKTNNLMNTMPVDYIANRMMAEIHYYTPYQYTLMEKDESWGKMFYYWGKDYHSTTDPTRNATWGEEADVDKYFGMMKTKFVDKGIPVVLGEYCAMRRNTLTGEALALHLASRAHFHKYVTQKAKANGLIPFFWDTGSLLSRSSNAVLDQQTLDALIEGAK